MRNSRGRTRCVVTGAAGFIGSHLVDALLDKGHHVVGIDSFSPYYAPARKRDNLVRACAHLRFELLPARINDLRLDEVLRPDDYIFHLAGQPGVRSSWGSGFGDYVRDNVEATHALVEAGCRVGASRLVCASSSSVYGNAPLPMREDGPCLPISPYGVTKLAAEQLCLVYGRRHGLPVVPLRLFTVYGPRHRPDMAFHRFIAAICAGVPIQVYGDGEQRRDFTYVEDVVAAMVAAAERGEAGVPVNVAGGAAVSVREAVGLLEEIIGRRARLDFLAAPAGDARDTSADTRRLAGLGATALVGIREGLRRQVEWQTDGAIPVHRATVPVGRRPAAEPRRKVLLYSHDSYGLGHLRRNLAVAHALVARDPDVRVVLLSGSSAARSWRLPANCSVVTLPSVVKVAAGEYRAEGRRCTATVIAERSGLIASTLQRLRPHAFLVDHAPLGIRGELRPALELARDGRLGTRVILGLRDILDEPGAVRAAWDAQGIDDVLEHLYDAVLVYGCRDFFDVTAAYALPPAVAARTRFVGYVAKPDSLERELIGSGAWSQSSDEGDRRLIVLGGGGADAMPLFQRFLAEWPAISRVSGAHALIVTGPLLPPGDGAALQAAVGPACRVDVVPFSTSLLSLIRAADVVVSMGGYNSIVETLSARKPLVVCPRVAPRREQVMRAEILARRGLAHVHRLDDDTGRTLTETVLHAMGTDPIPAETWDAIDLQGAERTAADVLSAATPRTGMHRDEAVA